VLEQFGLPSVEHGRRRAIVQLVGTSEESSIETAESLGNSYAKNLLHNLWTWLLRVTPDSESFTMTQLSSIIPTPSITISFDIESKRVKGACRYPAHDFLLEVEDFPRGVERFVLIECKT